MLRTIITDTVVWLYRRGLSLHGRTLTVGWAKPKDKVGDGSMGVGSGSGGGGGESSDRGEHELVLIPPSEDAKVLFVGGLVNYRSLIVQPTATISSSSSSVSSSGSSGSGEEEDSGVNISPLQQDLLELMPGLVSIHKSANKTYAFVEFDSYQSAMAVMTRSLQQPPLVLNNGSPIMVGWSKENNLIDASNALSSFLLTEPPSDDSKVLFIGAIPNNISEQDIHALFTTSSSSSSTVAPPLPPPQSSTSSSSCVVSIRRPEGRDYAFVEFISAEAAREVMVRNRSSPLLINDAPVLIGE